MVGWGSPNGVGKPESTPKDRDSCVPYKLVIAIVISTMVLVVASDVLVVPGADVTGPVEGFVVHGIAVIRVASVRTEILAR
jgi:hypothetical protein